MDMENETTQPIDRQFLTPKEGETKTVTDPRLVNIFFTREPRLLQKPDAYGYAGEDDLYEGLECSED